MVRIPVNLTLLVAVALPAYAQTDSQDLAEREALRAGKRIRVTAPSIAEKLIEGDIIRVEDERLTLAPTKFGEPYREVPYAAITHLEVSRGTKKYTVAGAVVMGLAGGIAGYLVGKSQLEEVPGKPVCRFVTDYDMVFGATRRYSSCERPTEERSKAMALTLAGAAGGAALGAVIGSAIKIVRWEAIPVGNLSFVVSPAGRAEVSLALKAPF